MHLLNPTPVPADLSILTATDPTHRIAMVTAKATFRVATDGRVALDTEAPLPVNLQDVETPLGILPRDILPKLDGSFEVMVLGLAHSPTGAPVPQLDVSLTVGDLTRRLRATGDRVWEGEPGENARVGPPEPFVELPMTWARAFGGAARVELDPGSFVELAHPLNAEGRGHDHVTEAVEMGKALSCPEGFPRFDPVRPLPNIEDPDAPVAAWSDEPLPVCWAPVPMSSGMLAERLRRRDGESPQGPDFGDPLLFERAHPDWIIAPPPERATVRLEGMTPGGAPFEFDLPPARVLADLDVGGSAKRMEVRPRALVLLPEERRFYIVFRGGTHFVYKAPEERVLRLSLARGWQPPGAPPLPAPSQPEDRP